MTQRVTACFNHVTDAVILMLIFAAHKHTNLCAFEENSKALSILTAPPSPSPLLYFTKNMVAQVHIQISRHNIPEKTKIEWKYFEFTIPKTILTGAFRFGVRVMKGHAVSLSCITPCLVQAIYHINVHHINDLRETLHMLCQNVPSDPPVSCKSWVIFAYSTRALAEEHKRQLKHRFTDRYDFQSFIPGSEMSELANQFNSNIVDTQVQNALTQICSDILFCHSGKTPPMPPPPHTPPAQTPVSSPPSGEIVISLSHKF